MDQIYSMTVKCFLAPNYQRHCIWSSIAKTFGKLSVLKMAIEGQYFSSVLEKEQQHGCEINECSFFRVGLSQKIDKICNNHRPLALVV